MAKENYECVTVTNDLQYFMRSAFMSNMILSALTVVGIPMAIALCAKYNFSRNNDLSECERIVVIDTKYANLLLISSRINSIIVNALILSFVMFFAAKALQGRGVLTNTPTFAVVLASIGIAMFTSIAIVLVANLILNHKIPTRERDLIISDTIRRQHDKIVSEKVNGDNQPNPAYPGEQHRGNYAYSPYLGEPQYIPRQNPFDDQLEQSYYDEEFKQPPYYDNAFKESYTSEESYTDTINAAVNDVAGTELKAAINTLFNPLSGIVVATAFAIDKCRLKYKKRQAEVEEGQYL